MAEGAEVVETGGGGGVEEVVGGEKGDVGAAGEEHVATLSSRMVDGVERHTFKYKDRVIYEWSQSVEEVDVFISPPPGVRASDISCKIERQRLTVGLKGNPPFLDHPLTHPIVLAESTWIFDDGELQITLQKEEKAKVWSGLFLGHGELDAESSSKEQKALMLERFQAEHPGFDFSGAEFNGAVPDPAAFMGGMREVG